MDTNVRALTFSPHTLSLPFSASNSVDSPHLFLFLPVRLKHFVLTNLFVSHLPHRWIVYRTNSWGYLKNGTFDGMIGALVRKEIDVGGSPIFFRIERAKVIDYTARTWISR